MSSVKLQSVMVCGVAVMTRVVVTVLLIDHRNRNHKHYLQTRFDICTTVFYFFFKPFLSRFVSIMNSCGQYKKIPSTNDFNKQCTTRFETLLLHD